MKKLVIISFLISAVLPSLAQDMSREEQIQALTERNSRAAAGHNPYETSVIKDTPPPRGFKAVYVSHYGRHGSRYQGGREPFEEVLPLMDSLASVQALTPEGDSLRHELHLMYEAHEDMEGLLTQKGSREQKELAERLCRRFPKLFRQKNAVEVYASSTHYVRCLQSMANFMTAVKGHSPSLQITYNTGMENFLHYLAPRTDAEYKSYVKSCYVPVQDSLLKRSETIRLVAQRLFTDVSDATPRFIYEIFEAAQGAACLDIELNPLRFFTADELYELLEIRNLYFCANYGPLAPSKERREKMAAPLLRGIVKEADAALAGNGRCADFRFGHDSGYGPLVMLMGVEGFDRYIDPRHSLLQWPAWKCVPMCSNIQIVFYRNRKGDVLVKFIRNEIETRIPALNPVSEVYYRWDEVRRYFLTRTGDYRQLPDYYKDYLDGKAYEILALKKTEADGFFYWTDPHFPENAGNSAAILEYLQNMVGPRKLFFGGDAGKNAKNLEPGLGMNTSALLQAGLYGNMFPIRGNHDFTSTTSKKEVAPETMGNLAVSRHLASFRSPEAHVNDKACCPNYYYVDNHAAKIRYIVLDTSEKVADSRISYGMSDAQISWMFDEAVCVPSGWALVLLTHIPLAKDHTTDPSLLRVEEKLRQLEKNASVILCQSGHRHSDIESGIGTVFQVMTAADCLIDTGRTVLPYAEAPGKKVTGTLNEQILDYVSISKDHKSVRMIRVGNGHDRIFHVRPISLSVGEILQLAPSCGHRVEWFAFDAVGNVVTPFNEDGVRYYETSTKNVGISADGLVRCMSDGEAIAVATHPDGTREYFMIKSISHEKNN